MELHIEATTYKSFSTTCLKPVQNERCFTRLSAHLITDTFFQAITLPLNTRAILTYVFVVFFSLGHGRFCLHPFHYFLTVVQPLDVMKCQ